MTPGDTPEPHQTQPPSLKVDALPPPGIADKAIDIGVAKANMPFTPKLLLSLLAGVYIGLGAIFYTVVITDSGMGFGVTKLLGGLAFSLGLILVVVGGAALFTGNSLIVMATLSHRITVLQLLRNWVIVYFGNFAGSLLLAALVFWSGQPGFHGGAVGVTMIKVADYKCGLDFMPALFLGILCNLLVCLAVWLTYGGRTVVDKIAAIVFPITAFVAAGFEHSIANMYFILVGLMAKASPVPGTPMAEAAANAGNLNIQNFLLKNLLPVTIGNVIGGAVFVGAIYWAIYSRKKTAA